MKNSTNLKDTKQKDALNIRWMLVGYDLIVYAIVASILLAAYGGTDKLSSTGILQQVCLSAVCIFAVRLLGKIYGQVWRYGGIQCYIRLLFTDAIAFLVYLCLELCFQFKNHICQNAFSGQPESVRRFGTPHDVSLCIQMWKSGNSKRKVPFTIVTSLFRS